MDKKKVNPSKEENMEILWYIVYYNTGFSKVTAIPPRYWKHINPDGYRSHKGPYPTRKKAKSVMYGEEKWQRKM